MAYSALALSLYRQVPPMVDACSKTVIFDIASRFAAAEIPAGPAPIIPTEDSLVRNDFLKLNSFQNINLMKSLQNCKLKLKSRDLD